MGNHSKCFKCGELDEFCVCKPVTTTAICSVCGVIEGGYHQKKCLHVGVVKMSEIHPAPQAASQQADTAMRLLREARAALETWKDVVPAVSLCADIDKFLAPQAATTASASTIKTWQERAIELGSAALDPKTAYGLLQAEIDDLRAALARAPLPAQQVQAVDVARDAARYRFIEEHATMHGGGNGFTITCFVPVDHEDIGCGIDAAIEKGKA